MNEFFGNKSGNVITAPNVNIQPLMQRVYLWMTMGLLLTAGVALYVTSSPALINAIKSPGIFMGAIILEIALVIGLSWGLMRLSPGMAIALFFVYAAVNGFTLSIIFLVYNIGTIQLAFVSTAATFAVMSVVGYTTQLDLSQYRTYFIMGLIGLLIALVVNIFLRSSGLDLLISMVGVVLFTALTAYDTQKIKRMAAQVDMSSDGSLAMKVSIWGALQLYLDFINLFIYILRLLGRRR